MGDNTHLFIAGAIAGTCEVVVVQPLDMLKTRFQLSPGHDVGVLAGLRTVAAEGGAQRLYRGIVPELLCGIPKSSAMYAAYAQTRTLVTRARGGRDDALTSFCAGAVSGVPEALIVTPFQVVKVRLQAKEHTGRYHNAWHCVRTMLAIEGAASLATGLQVTIMRNCVWNSVYFASYAALNSKARALRGAELTGWSGRALSMSLGFCAGVFATCFNCPFDVVKSRMQAEVSGTAVGSASSDPSMLARMAHIARTEGTGALWKGFTAKSLRMGTGGAVGLATFELSLDLLRRL